MSRLAQKSRYNVHFRISTMPRGFMVLDYDATPANGNIYNDEPKGYQMVIMDVSPPEAKRVCDLLNAKEEQIKELKNDFQQYHDTVANFLFENISLFGDDLINQINNELGIDLCDMLELYDNS